MSDPASRLDALAAAWDHVVAMLEGQRWPDEVMRLDLAMLVDRATHPRKPERLPGKVVLARRWGVSRAKAGRMLAELGDIVRSVPRPAAASRLVSHPRATGEPPVSHPTTEERPESATGEPPVSHPRATGEPSRARTIIPAPGSRLTTPPNPPAGGDLERAAAEVVLWELTEAGAHGEDAESAVAEWLAACGDDVHRRVLARLPQPKRKRDRVTVPAEDITRAVRAALEAR